MRVLTAGCIMVKVNPQDQVDSQEVTLPFCGDFSVAVSNC
jgi:hypothetical protein